MADLKEYLENGETNGMRKIATSKEIKATNVKTRGFDRLNPNSMGTPNYDYTTRTFSISPVTGQDSFYFMTYGNLFTKTTTQSVVWPDVTGTYYFHFDTDGVLQVNSHHDVNEATFVTNAIAGLVYWNAEDQKGWHAIDEQHGMIMDASTHFNKHMTKGFTWSHGGEIDGLVDAVDSFGSISQSVHFDEDIVNMTDEVVELAPMYRTGTNGRWVIDDTAVSDKLGYIPTGFTYVAFNTFDGTTWGLTESALTTDYIIYFILKTNFEEYPYRLIVGQTAYASRADARYAMRNDIRAVKLAGLPSTEAEFQFAYICKRNGTVEDDGHGKAYEDLRGRKINSL